MGDVKVISKVVKKLWGVGIGIIIALILLLTILYMPILMIVDWESIEKVDTNVQVLAAGEGINDTDYTAVVKLNANGSIDNSDWKIISFTDLHLSEQLKAPKKTIDEMAAAIMREQPDLVIFTGDVITSTQNKLRAIQFANVMEKLGVYWMYCLGNHEGEKARAIRRDALVDLWAGYDHCLIENDTKYTADGTKVWGNGNYVINVLGAGADVIQSLIFMDSGDALCESDYKRLTEAGYQLKKDGYDFLKESQVQWYREQIAKITGSGNENVKSMLYIHIPLPEFDYTEKVDGVAVAKNGWELVGGKNYEGICSSDYNSGTYDALVELGSTKAVFVGHDHINTAVVRNVEDKVFLCYNQASGYATYTLYSNGFADSPEDNLNGYALTTLYQDGTFDFGTVRYADKGTYMPIITRDMVD